MTERETNEINKDVPPWLQPVPEAEQEGEGGTFGRAKLLMVGLAVVVVAIFVGAIAFLYPDTQQEGTRHIAADTSPVRERPEEAGGLRVDHQDKAVLEIGDGAPAAASVQIGAQPEQPVETIPDLPVETASSSVAESADTIGDIAEAALEAEPEAAPAAPVVQPTVEEAAPAVSAPVEQPTQATGQYAVQLGAYGSEQTAERAWNTIRNKFSRELEGLGPIYIPVQSGDRTLYRLRVGMLEARSDADAVCIALRAQQQACFAVNP